MDTTQEVVTLSQLALDRVRAPTSSLLQHTFRKTKIILACKISDSCSREAKDSFIWDATPCHCVSGS